MGTLELTINCAGSLSRKSTRDYACRMQKYSDQQLMLRYQDGDIAAFEQLYRRHNASFYRYLLRLSGEKGTAEDLFQEAWAKLIKAKNSYAPTAQFSTYLYTIGHRCFIDHARKHSRVRTVDPALQELADPAPAPDETAELSLARERLGAALQLLPPQQRDVFLLKEEAGLDLAAIATVTGASREAVKSQLRYAVEKLRVAMVSGNPQEPRHE